jgi:integrase
MGNRQLNRLSARTILTKKRPGLFCDGGGLYLQVAPGGAKTWIFRYRDQATKKLRYMGLGSLRAVNLPEARERAGAQRNLLSQGIDPLSARAQETAQKTLAAARAATFSDCAESYIESHRASWKNSKHADQWIYSTKTFCNPVFGSMAVQDIDTELVLRALEPIWTKIPETASRVRGRIEVILDWAKARGYRQGENPARWKGHLNQLLPSLSKSRRVRHYPALPYEDIGAFMAQLRLQQTFGALALELTILTAARSGEVLLAEPDEFDLDKAIWTIPGTRMKAGREHRIPLSPPALRIVEKMLALEAPHLFPGLRQGRPLSNMAMLAVIKRMNIARKSQGKSPWIDPRTKREIVPHGFRSTFRDWAAEQTSFTREVCEMALAHTVQDKTEAAYRRGDMFEKRKRLMATWAEFLSKPMVAQPVAFIRHVA